MRPNVRQHTAPLRGVQWRDYVTFLSKIVLHIKPHILNISSLVPDMDAQLKGLFFGRFFIQGSQSEAAISGVLS
jgi:hypothetical protein